MSGVNKIRIPRKATAQQIREALRIGPVSRKAGQLALKKTEETIGKSKQVATEGAKRAS